MSTAFDIPGRIKCGTVTCPDFDGSLADYTGPLGLAVVETGTVPADLAASWDAPASAGKRHALLAAPGGNPCFIRLVESTPVADFKILRSHGWAAFEHTVADCFTLYDEIETSCFLVIGAPQLVPGFDNFIPFQVVGRAGEVLYLNQVLQPAMAGLDLPPATARIDQIFIAILAAPDREAAIAFHRDALGFEVGDTWTIPYSVINNSFDLPRDTLTAMTMTRTGRMPATEIDQYPAAATPRPTTPGELPPGNAMVSFITASLDSAPLIAPPVRRDGPLYAGRRTATVRGTAGELIELIEA